MNPEDTSKPTAGSAEALPKAYDPGAIESRWAEYWVNEKLFHLPTPDSAQDVFTLLIPPPNVTGRLHMGHMLNQTEMDIIIRWQRMSGKKTLWLPGTDHAGIATQMMVERQLQTEGKQRQDLGREKFIERVWQWRELYGGAILSQMKRLGASVDWQREYFTMDDQLSRGVREAFVRLHEKGLIYRGKYIVNWCPRCLTAISDLEVVHEESAGKLYEIRYPVVGEKGIFITVATTRPETMLGDTGVAVNAKDPRYQTLIGKKVIVPLMNREIPIVADDWANPEFGTGAVKITPAHDPNDFAVGQRHSLEQLNVMDEQARMNANAGAYAGLDRYKAREKVLADLEAQGLLGVVKDHQLSIGKCVRCNTVVEPRLSVQWFLKVKGAIADRAIEVVKRDFIKITPDNYKTIYLNWMENIYDWCISRQLWWGHRIPAWHCADCEKDTVARDTPSSCAYCGSAHIEQDTDVLDTWFSSGLLPFTVFGWPDKTKDLQTFYPTTLLITGFDILFFWVARMIMLGTWFMGDEDGLDKLPAGAERDKKLAASVPFENVYIHALVRDADRQKMSKTKGNVIDPIEITEKYGTDAVRFTLASMASPGTDIAFSETRTESYRAFANKIWNAARFIFMNVDRAEQSGAWSRKAFNKGSSAQRPQAQPEAVTLEDRWILSRLNAATAEVHSALTEYRFHEAAHVVYHFFWGEFCDWYIEIVKLRLNAGESEADKQTTATALDFLLYVFETALRLLSPFMPFITEEIWHAVYDGQTPQKSIALAPYPQSRSDGANPQAEAEMTVLQALIVDVRTLRADMKIEPKVKAPIELHASAAVRKSIEASQRFVERMANIEAITFVDASLSNTASVRVAPQYEVRVVYEQKIDVAAERERLTKELKKLETELTNAERNLSNEQFLAKAPSSVVDGIRRRQGELVMLIEKSRAALAQLDK
ncbi:MAG: valine--tRNA ligase [Terriglobales bacterium]